MTDSLGMPHHAPAPATGRRAPRVSVVMNCYNGETYLREAMDSVVAQTVGDWEIVFVDNASTDASPEIARSYGDRVRYVRNPETVSLGRSRNVALEHCTGDLIAFLDCDDLWEPTKLERQLPLFDDERVGLAYSDCWLLRNGRRIGRRYEPGAHHPVGRCLNALLADYSLVLSTAVIRRKALQQLDEWFDPALQLAEEADIFLRLAIGWELAMVPEALASYRLHANSESVRKMELYGVENVLILEKLRRLVPRFNEQHGDAAARWTDNGLWSTAVAAWKRGDGHAARDAIGRTKRRGWKHRALLVASVAPYSACRGVLNLVRGRPWTE